MNSMDGLLLKMEKDPKFKQTVLKNEETYHHIKQSLAHLETPNVTHSILKQLKGHEVYFYFGFLQPALNKNLRQVLIYLVRNFEPNTETGYKLVFFNDKSFDNYTLWNFRQTLSCLKLAQISALTEFIVVNPFFYHKTMDWMTFGVINKLIKQKTKFVYGYKALCQHLSISEDQLAAHVPSALFENELPELFCRSVSKSILQINVPEFEKIQWETDKPTDFQKTIRSWLAKPGKQSIYLHNYEIGAEGIPNILKMLIFYFDCHHEGLLLEGIFRKSVSIDDENETINEILSKNYDYILQVQNPHIIANLIKRFFSALKIPIFPFAQFQKLMKDQNTTSKLQHLKQVYDMLPELNRLTLTFVITFLIDKVIPNEAANKMGIQNIAICFSPCFFRSETTTAAEFVYVAKSVEYTKLLLTNFTDICGSKMEREANFRRSYEKQKQNFDHELDIGIEQAVKAGESLDSKNQHRVGQKQEKNMGENEGKKEGTQIPQHTDKFGNNQTENHSELFESQKKEDTF